MLFCLDDILKTCTDVLKYSQKGLQTVLCNFVSWIVGFTLEKLKVPTDVLRGS